MCKKLMLSLLLACGLSGGLTENPFYDLFEGLECFYDLFEELECFTNRLKCFSNKELLNFEELVQNKKHNDVLYEFLKKEELVAVENNLFPGEEVAIIPKEIGGGLRYFSYRVGELPSNEFFNIYSSLFKLLRLQQEQNKEREEQEKAKKQKKAKKPIKIPLFKRS